MVNYGNGKIYKIVTSQSDDIYIGSTCQTLSRRMSVHRSLFRCKKLLAMSKILFEKYGCDTCRIILLESYSCDNNEELRAKEQDWIDKTDKCINKIRAFRTNKQKIKFRKIYYQDHNDHIKEKQKQYRKDNKDKIKDINKKYREQNQTKIADHKGKQLICTCGSTYTNSHKTRHDRTTKHQNYIKMYDDIDYKFIQETEHIKQMALIF